MKYVIGRGEGVPSCLPEDLDTTDLKDITELTDRWRKYLNVKTGVVHDGATYWAACLIGGLDITPGPAKPVRCGLCVGDKVRTGVYVCGEWVPMQLGVVTAISADGQVADVDIMSLHGGRPWIKQEQVSHLRKEQA